ncbi:Alcohol dehydrogenase 1 [Bienertia sinuspersici]
MSFENLQRLLPSHRKSCGAGRFFVSWVAVMVAGCSWVCYGGGVSKEGVSDVEPGDHVLPMFTGECKECAHCKSEESNMCDLLRINTGRV